jgi:hypothetical protein
MRTKFKKVDSHRLFSRRGLFVLEPFQWLVNTKATTSAVARAKHAATPIGAATRDIPVATATRAYAVGQASFAATSKW